MTVVDLAFQGKKQQNYRLVYTNNFLSQQEPTILCMIHSHITKHDHFLDLYQTGDAPGYSQGIIFYCECQFSYCLSQFWHCAMFVLCTVIRLQHPCMRQHHCKNIKFINSLKIFLRFLFLAYPLQIIK